jgi:sec-independent protein translocase protein TatB
MFDIGFWELMMIGLIGLLVIGPDKLPSVARSTGKWVGRFRRFVTDVKSDIDRELKQDEIRQALEKNAGLDEIKEIMNNDDFIIREEDVPDYQVKAIPDEEYNINEDEELKHITDHSDGAEK